MNEDEWPAKEGETHNFKAWIHENFINSLILHPNNTLWPINIDDIDA